MARRPPEPRPAASYRLQLRPEFSFGDVVAVAPYLRDLGVTHAYLSPVFEARAGSTHGYDVTDPTRVRDELGGEDGFTAMVDTLHANDLGVIVDIVPNHQAASDQNPRWRDVAERGEASDSATFFDIDWDAPGDDLSYRRFFDIDDLAAVRQEDPRVFEETHRRVIDWARDGTIDGIRIDHVDGLRDPTAYLHRMADATGGCWTVVEKILERTERLPRAWPVAGTTGYEFASAALELFVDRAGEGPLTQFYEALTGDHRTWVDVAVAGKFRAMDGGLAPDVARVARLLGGEGWAATVRHAAAHFIVYRSYLPPLDDAVARFQQLTSAVMAKGVEDTAYYEYVRFIALNEVGCDPGRFGGDVADWHARCEETAARWPQTMLATSTHDTKRGEDVRARLAVISEVADWWTDAAARWMKTHGAPDPATAYLLLQTLVGAWPVSEDRAQQYMQKAVREAGVHTTWADVNDAFEAEVRDAVSRAIADPELPELVQPLVEPGRRNSLAQTLLRLTAPGVPDTYQGTELWDLSLVDPDNRRPVDYDERRRLLASPPDKMRVLTTALRARRGLVDASYAPLATDGPDGDHVVAFTRGGELTTVVPRLNARGLIDAGVELPSGRWMNAFTGEQVGGGWQRAADVFASFPVALLHR